MTQAIVIIICLATLAVVVWYLRKKKIGAKPNDTASRVRRIKNRGRTTRGGVKLWIEDGADVTAAESDAIDNGLREVFSRALARGYDRPLNLTDYTVAILADSQRAPQSGVWSYKLPAGVYAGTEWDLGGYILAAGETVFYSNDPEGNLIALPYHHGTNMIDDLANLSRVAAYEGEHIILFHCDYTLWQSTAVHGVGQGHPLF